MRLEDLVRLLESRLAALNGAVATATSLGDLSRISELEAQVLTTQDTLDRVRTLLA
jgi:hypothetical protein